ncbi:TatD family deoxyribonuclease [Geobacillus thermocatenulatus]|uniref:TatD family deoxyribonuclease n=1 Tax=Geobacillus thermocatenulatus TaxID=33938 RepID=A0A226Q5C9_9BACL|nr:MULTISPECIES: TatD family hydrolase [Geobacillus]ASS97691.1 TatD family deoxyribonuclease [Geobacillus thermocatenulatus]KLR74939.1 deoxyribonuclease [Geobacillus sp. T6]OXB87204.1 TatD family deoxyribonuclease [Geobacillus thermocatenulatus]RAN30741.1 deoxyribonuclease [Geobacillus sp. A8]
MIDAHLHLDQYRDIDEQINRWQEAGITGVVAVSTDLRSSHRTLELKRRFPSFVYAAIGFHPEQPLPSESDWNEWTKLVRQERPLLAAIGEVGLPYYSAEACAKLPAYQERLAEVAAIAVEASLPLALHAVYDRAETALAILQQAGVRHAHFHWLKAEPAVVKQIIEYGCYISVTPEVCYRERDKKLLSLVPLEQLLLETDGPWPFAGPFQGKSTTPLWLFDSVRVVAAHYGQDIEQVKTVITANTKQLYGAAYRVV